MYNFLKFFAAVGCILLAQNGFAQFSKGSLLVGGGIGFSSTQNQSGNTYYDNPSGQAQVSNGTSIGIYPNLSYAIKDNWVASFETGFSSDAGSERRTDLNNPTYYTNVTTGSSYRIPITLGIRHYWNLGKKFHLGLGASTGIGIKSGKSHSGSEGSGNSDNFSDTKTTGLDWHIGISPNLTYLLGDRVLLSLSSGYWGYYQSKSQASTTYTTSVDERTNTNEYNYSSFSGNLSLNSIQIGAYYSIQPKAKKTE